MPVVKKPQPSPRKVWHVFVMNCELAIHTCNLTFRLLKTFSSHHTSQFWHHHHLQRLTNISLIRAHQRFIIHVIACKSKKICGLQNLSKINEVVSGAAKTGTKRKLDYTGSALSPPSPKQMTLMIPRPAAQTKVMQIVQRMSQDRQEASRNYLSTTTS